MGKKYKLTFSLYDGSEKAVVFEVPEGEVGPVGPQGETGPAGPQGNAGPTGPQGASAYEVAVENGFEGTEEEWLATLGTVSPSTNASQEEAIYGEELASASGWTTSGWTGSFASGFTHTSGNTSPLIYAMPVATGTKLYQVSFTCSKSIEAMTLFVSVGGSEQFDLFGQVPTSFGVRSVSDGNLEFIPASNFNGTLTNISIKEIIGTFKGIEQVTDSQGKVSYEIRPTSFSKSNIFLGAQSGMTNTSGYGNASLGASALKNNTSGFWNIGMGYEALRENTAGTRNVGIGYGALRSNICGHRNIAIGSYALLNNKTGGWNIAIGADCQDHNQTGSNNVAVGFQAMYYNESGTNNLALGNSALKNGKSSTYNVALGDNAATYNNGSYNVAIGKSALQTGSTGNSNMAIGLNTLYRNTGNSNTAIGVNALKSISTGNNNVGIGANAGQGGVNAAITGVTDNVFIGAGAGSGILDNSKYNVFIGKNAGSTNTSGTNNILIGNGATTDAATDSYRLNIGGLLLGSIASQKFLTINGGLDLSLIPTEDPKQDGRAWVQNGVLRVSGAETPDYYSRSEIDAIMGSYINDVDALLGGEA